jgi:hypothetical protein
LTAPDAPCQLNGRIIREGYTDKETTGFEQMLHDGAHVFCKYAELWAHKLPISPHSLNEILDIISSTRYFLIRIEWKGHFNTGTIDFCC